MDIAEILLEVLERGASDLHITVGLPPMIRSDGRLQALNAEPMSADRTRELIYSILTQEQRQRLETDWEIDFSYSFPGKARFRVNAFFQ
ncbi:MAG TPA: type IV pili twitching motility protein PilT, partial [Thermoleophilia bacterium]|nr:type IV pili twitching motility protein PilT [Thermoleophilia bacterium]